MPIRIENAERIRRQYNAFSRDVRTGRTGREINRSIGIVYRNAIRRNAPSRTGNLRRSIRLELLGKQFIIRIRSPYAFYLEFGTRHIRPRRFVRNVLSNAAVRRLATNAAVRIMNRRIRAIRRVR